MVNIKPIWAVARSYLKLSAYSVKIYLEVLPLWVKNGFYPILLAHGSIGDQFLAASLLDEYVCKNGRTIVIISSNYRRVFELFIDNTDVILVGLSEKRCQKITENWQVVSDILPTVSHISWLIMTFRLKPTHVVRYPDESREVEAYMRGQDGLHHMTAQRKVLNLPLEGYGKRPKYTELDELDASMLFSTITNDLSRVALISPICYTHQNIRSELWLSVAKALQTEGFLVIFNIAGNVGAKEFLEQIVPPGFPTIKVPAYLAPKIGTLCGLICGRVGGGFVIFQSILRPRRSLLVVLDQDNSVPNYTRDPPAQIVVRSCARFFGNEVDHVAVLKPTDQNVIVEETIYRSLRTTIRQYCATD